MSSLSISFPAYNEEANIGQAVQQALAVAPRLTDDYEVIVVDDGSRDRTADVVRELERQHPRVRLVEHEVNKGFGEGDSEGFGGGVVGEEPS